MRGPVWVGLKTTLITHFDPAASVDPHFVFWVKTKSAKSPLVATLLMLSVPVPVLVTVTTFVVPVPPTAIFPHLSEVGVKVTVGPPWLDVTVRPTVVVWVMLPETPVTVTVEDPMAALALAVNVRLLVVVVGFGLNPAVTPEGRPDALRVTLPVKPSAGVTVMVVEAVLP